MKYSQKLIFFIFSLPLFSFGQSNYKPGFAISLKGDTLPGFIDYRNWDMNPSSIYFKMASGDNSAKKFTTEEISFFKVNGLESFQKYSGPMSTDGTNINNLTEGRDTSFKLTTVFLKVLQKGPKVALYSYSDNLKTRFFISEAPDFVPRELVFRLYYDLDAVTQTKGRSVYEKGYIRQLLILAARFNVLNDGLQNNIRGASYTQRDLSHVVSEINSVSKDDYKRNYSSEAKELLFVSGGLNIIKTSAARMSPYYADGGKSYTSYQPLVSLGFDALANPNTGKLRFRLEASIARSQYRVSYQNSVYPFTGIKSSYDELWVSLTPQIIYNIYNTDNFKFYMGAGIFFTWYSYRNTFFGSPNSTANFAQEFPYYFNTYDNAFLIKTGVQMGRHLGIYVNYLTNVPTTKNPYFQLSKNGEQVGVNYFF